MIISSQFFIETHVYLNHFSRDKFKNLDVDNKMSLSCGWEEPHSWPKNAFFIGVISIYFVTFFFEHTVVDCRDLATAKSKNKNSLIDKNCENHIGKNSLDWVLESFKSQIDLWLFAGWYVGVKRDYIKWSLNRYVWLSIWRHKPKLLCIAIWSMNKLPFIFYQNVFWWNSKFFLS